MQFEMMAAYTRRDLSDYYRLNALIHSAHQRGGQEPGADRDLQPGQCPPAGAALPLQPGRREVGRAP